MVKTVGIILNGATGRICSTQHLENSLIPIRDNKDFDVNGDVVSPKLLLLGRNEKKLSKIAKRFKIENWTTDLNAALADEDYSIFFDAASTHLRLECIKKAMEAEKHIYTEKPLAPSVEEGESLLKIASSKNLKHGVVEDKIFVPGLRKMNHLIKKNFLGRIVSFNLTFGWWVFDGTSQQSQRSSWNYKKSGGGGLLFDMYPHWRYVIEGLLGPIKRVVSANWTAQPNRIDEEDNTFGVDVEDSSATILELVSGAFGTIQSSWATRVRVEDLFTLQIDGTNGSVFSTLRNCWAQSASSTPKITGFNLGGDEKTMKFKANYLQDWEQVPEIAPYKNPYRFGWEGFLQHVLSDTPFLSDFSAGIRDIQLSEACLRSGTTDSWVAMK
ncbi:MAG: Gfo/Idh/MocA family oxidoreductase [Nitrospinota bacterium]|nr:Gfo/Idh/MocA family oxidoreductase [Nitrospinota bacterium]